MPKHPTSQNVQNPMIDASNSLEKAENAAKQVMSHPTETMMKQARNALRRSENALNAARSSENEIAVDHLEARRNQVVSNLDHPTD